MIEIIPVVESKDTLERSGLIDKVNVPVPPVAEKAVVESALVNVVLILLPPLTLISGFTITVRFLTIDDPTESVIVTVSYQVPAAVVDATRTTPVVESIDIPAAVNPKA